MAVTQLYVQDEDYVARDDRLIWAAMLPRGGSGQPLGRPGGVMQPGDFAITGTGPTATIGTGVVAIPWSGRHYLLANDANVTVSFTTTSLGRIDTVVARVYDTEAGGAAKAAEIVTIPGTAAATPAAPALPAGAFPLYNVTFAANASTGTVTDRRAYVTGESRAVINLGPLGWNHTSGPPSTSDWSSKFVISSSSLPAGRWLLIAKGYMDISLAGSVIWRYFLETESPLVTESRVDCSGVVGTQRVPWLMVAYTSYTTAKTLFLRIARNGNTAGAQLMSQGQIVGIPL